MAAIRQAVEAGDGMRQLGKFNTRRLPQPLAVQKGSLSAGDCVVAGLFQLRTHMLDENSVWAVFRLSQVFPRPETNTVFLTINRVVGRDRN